MNAHELNAKITVQLTEFVNRLCSNNGSTVVLTTASHDDVTVLYADSDEVVKLNPVVMNKVLGVMCAQITREFSNMKPSDEAPKSCLDIINQVASEYKPNE